MSPFDRWYLDLSVVMFLTGIAWLVVALGTTGWLRVAVVVPLVTVLPGYAFMSALYPTAGNHATRTFDETESGLQNPLPSKEGVDSQERLGLSVVASLAIVPAVALVANFSPWGITLTPLLVGVSGVTVLFTVVGLLRRARLPPERRYTPPLSGAFDSVTYSELTSGLGTASNRRRYYNLALGVSVLLFAASVGIVAVTPPGGQGFTEFYLDTENVTGDTQSLYPSQFDPGETKTLPVTITNQEHEQMQYEVVVLLQRVDGTEGESRTVAQERAASQTVTVDHGQTRETEIEVSPSMSGSDLQYVLLLYRGDAPDKVSVESAYRTLRLPITVGDTTETPAAISREAGPERRP